MGVHSWTTNELCSHSEKFFLAQKLWKLKTFIAVLQRGWVAKIYLNAFFLQEFYVSLLLLSVLKWISLRVFNIVRKMTMEFFHFVCVKCYWHRTFPKNNFKAACNLTAKLVKLSLYINQNPIMYMERLAKKITKR